MSKKPQQFTLYSSDLEITRWMRYIAKLRVRLTLICDPLSERACQLDAPLYSIQSIIGNHAQVMAAYQEILQRDSHAEHPLGVKNKEYRRPEWFS